MLAHTLIDPDAEKVVRRLARRGHKAYLVGGCVRDLLLERTPKDFDVATSATPNEIKQLFRNCRIIGRRFRLAHIFFGNKIIETATFRANPRREEDAELLIRRDNVFGTETEDARRRDFTVNGLFYDMALETVIDHVGGLDDLEAKLIRTIGVPQIRFREDPVRMLRAVKFAARLGFDIEAATYAALIEHRGEITKCAPPRVLEEFYRMLRGGAAGRSVKLLIDTGVAHVLSPQLAGLFDTKLTQASAAKTTSSNESEWAATWDAEAHVGGLSTDNPALRDPVELAKRRELAFEILAKLDERSAAGKSVSNALILSAIVYPFVMSDVMQPGLRPIDASEIVLNVLGPLVAELRVARRDAERTRQVLLAQRRLAPSRRRRGRPMALVRRDYFDDALLLYELTAEASGRDTADVERWHQLRQEGDPTSLEQRAEATPRKRRRRRRGGRRRRRSTGGEAAVNNEATVG